MASEMEQAEAVSTIFRTGNPIFSAASQLHDYEHWFSRGQRLWYICEDNDGMYNLIKTIDQPSATAILAKIMELFLPYCGEKKEFFEGAIKSAIDQDTVAIASNLAVLKEMSPDVPGDAFMKLLDPAYDPPYPKGIKELATLVNVMRKKKYEPNKTILHKMTTILRDAVIPSEDDLMNLWLKKNS